MKILLLTHIYPPAIDGGSRVIAKIGEEFLHHGHQLLVLTSTAKSTDDFTKRTNHSFGHSKKYPIIRLPYLTFTHRPFKLLSKLFPSLLPFAKGPIFNPFSLILALRLIKKFHPDLIIAGPLPTTIIIYANLLKFLTKAKLIFNASLHPFDSEFQSILLTHFLKKVDFIWSLTNFESDYYQSHLKIKSSKIINIGNGVDKPTNINYHSPKYDLIFIGSLSAHKGFEILFKLPQSFNIAICGQTTLYFEDLLTKIKLNPNIHIFHHLSDQEIFQKIADSKILILPSKHESFGLVLLESWILKRPVITSDIPQLKELVSKAQGGISINTQDLPLLITTINKLLTNRYLYNQYKTNGYRYALNHTWDKIYISLCQKIFST